MTKESYARLLPLLYRRSARQRVILYLIADGFTVGELTKMSVTELRRLTLPDEISIAREEMLEGIRSGLAFRYPSGGALPHTAYYRIVRMATQAALKKQMGQESFRKYVSGS